MEHKVAFIINPKAGVKKKINLEEFITQNFQSSFKYDLIVWKNKDDFESIKQQLLNNNYTIAVACGGDGTVNQVAATIVNTNIALGILPLGSGNGLARSNNIPMDLLKALQTIAKAQIKTIDSGLVNNIPFFCTAGIGFDALIADKFASSTKRGFATYFKTTVKEYFSYKPNNYKLVVDSQTKNTNAFLITVANAGQWGNDVYIAPNAKIDDGILHVSILKPFSNLAIPGVASKLLSKKIYQSNYFESLDGKNIEIYFDGELPAHFDGEPLTVNNKITFNIVPLSLKVIC